MVKMTVKVCIFNSGFFVNENSPCANSSASRIPTERNLVGSFRKPEILFFKQFIFMLIIKNRGEFALYVAVILADTYKKRTIVI